ncbi:winged helix-turn-helix domain-containing protein [Streptomyces griseoflavus]
MRYPQGGGLSVERRAFRERIRMEAAEMFAEEQDNAAVPTDPALQGIGCPSQAGRGLFVVLEQELAKGPVAHGWPDQTWTAARIKTLIGRWFHRGLTLSAIARTLRRHGWSHQVTARRTIERDEDAVTDWVKETWPQVRGPGRRSAAGSSSRAKQASR